MQLQLNSPDIQKAKAFAKGEHLPIHESEHLWSKHVLFFPEEGNYLQCLEKAKEILNSMTLVVTDKFVIIETVGSSECLAPVVVRCINFVHGGDKVIGSLDRILFIPDWCVDDTELIRHQLAETYLSLKLKTMTHWERFKFNTSMLVASFKGTASFNKAYMEMTHKLSSTTIQNKINFCS